MPKTAPNLLLAVNWRSPVSLGGGCANWVTGCASAADTSAAAAEQRFRELSKATTEMVMPSNFDEETSASPKAVKNKDGKAKVKRSLSSTKSEAANGHDKNCELPKLEQLSIHDQLVKEFKEQLLEGSTPSEMAKLKEGKEGSQQEIMDSYFEALFAGVSKGLSKEVAKEKLLTRVVQDDAAQDALLVAIESFFASIPDASKEVSLVLKVLYDEEIIEEENIMNWFTSKPSPSLGSKSDFVHPPAEAESEED